MNVPGVIRGQHGPPAAGSSSPFLCHFCHLALFAGAAASVWQSSKQRFGYRTRRANTPPPQRVLPRLSPPPLFQPSSKYQDGNGFDRATSGSGHLPGDGPSARARPHDRHCHRHPPAACPVLSCCWSWVIFHLRGRTPRTLRHLRASFHQLPAISASRRITES